MKPGPFIVLVGLAGAASGVATFLLTAPLFSNLAFRAVTGGLAAVLVPITIVMLYYPRLVSGKPEKKSDAD